NSALGLVNDPPEGLVRFSGYYYIEQGKTYYHYAYKKAMNALNYFYFAKNDTKPYHDGYRCFGCSQ
ncbi:YagK/YfjJ domain-containing protein, partial [Providencia stuartii]|uniref:YagK/YfjJ domain-containing protein n=1 Tax=Providencia stuartii TaxID=588 RepID=UPI001BCC34BE